MRRKIGMTVLGLLVLAGLFLTAWYQVDGQPRPEARAYLAGPGYTAVEEADGSLVFSPATPNGHGLLIMHGALIKPLAYARTAAYFANLGYLVYLPYGAARLSINAVDKAAARMDSFPVGDWYFLGHSMGGLSALTLLAKRPANVRALALWATALPADFSKVNIPVLFIHGDRDELLPPERFAGARANLPQTTRYLQLAGANHRDFALYTHQFFDGEGTLGWAAQIDQANAATAAFFAESGA